MLFYMRKASHYFKEILFLLIVGIIIWLLILSFFGH